MRGGKRERRAQVQKGVWYKIDQLTIGSNFTINAHSLHLTESTVFTRLQTELYHSSHASLTAAASVSIYICASMATTRIIGLPGLSGA